ncbi:hypothetical protein [Carp edema virus]|nr:hypothetical protein [Carp edema virus]
MKARIIRLPDYDVNHILQQDHNQVKVENIAGIDVSSYKLNKDKGIIRVISLPQIRIDNASNESLVLFNKIKEISMSTKCSNFLKMFAKFDNFKDLIVRLIKSENEVKGASVSGKYFIKKYFEIENVYVKCKACNLIYDGLDDDRSCSCYNIIINSEFVKNNDPIVLEKEFGISYAKIVSISFNKKLDLEIGYLFPSHLDFGFESETKFAEFLDSELNLNFELNTINFDDFYSGLSYSDSLNYLQVELNENIEKEISSFILGTSSSYKTLLLELLDKTLFWQNYFENKNMHMIDSNMYSNLTRKKKSTKLKIRDTVGAFNFNFCDSTEFYLIEKNYLDFNKYLKSVLFLNQLIILINPFDSKNEILSLVKTIRKIREVVNVKIFIIFVFESKSFEYINLKISRNPINVKISSNKKFNINSKDLLFLESLDHCVIATGLHKALHIIAESIIEFLFIQN